MAVKLKYYKNELNAKSLEELQSELVAAKKELFNLRDVYKRQVEGWCCDTGRWRITGSRWRRYLE